MLKLIRNLLQLPLQLILNRSVSEGNFQTKIYLEHPKEFRELSRCFNQMTEELAGIEMLRSDFINNFSHEFKPPMVSILGFSRLLKKGDLTAEEQKAMMIINDPAASCGVLREVAPLHIVEYAILLCLRFFFI